MPIRCVKSKKKQKISLNLINAVYLAEAAVKTLLHWRNRAGNDGFDVISRNTTPSQRIQYERDVLYAGYRKERAQLSPGWRRKTWVTP